MPNTKPYVQAASVCEKILIEPDGVASLIRLVDVFHIDLEGAPKIPDVPAGLDISIYVSLKSGDVKGDFKLGVQLNRPNGKKEERHDVPIVLQGGGHGSNIRMNVTLTNPEYGLHWFDLIWADEILTRIPLDLKKAKPPQTKTPDA